jgi:hypothetical protein
MSSSTFCLHVLVYITTLIYILSTLLNGVQFGLICTYGLQHYARVAGIGQRFSPASRTEQSAVFGKIYSIHRNVVVLITFFCLVNT